MVYTAYHSTFFNFAFQLSTFELYQLFCSTTDITVCRSVFNPQESFALNPHVMVHPGHTAHKHQIYT